MQNKEKIIKKGKPGYTDKRFWMRNQHRKAVDDFQSILKAKQRNTEIKWEQALEYLIETHPATKKLMPLK